jgi:hypothetical protein
MAQLSDPDWQPPSNNPLPRANTTVTFVATPRGNPDGGVRVTYFLVDPHVQFVLPSPPAAGAVEVSQAQDRLVEDHTAITTDSTSITRALTLQAIGQPALATLRVSVADMVGRIPVRERSSEDSITFTL